MEFLLNKTSLNPLIHSSQIYLKENNYQKNELSRLGIPDYYIQQGSRNDLLREVGLTVENVISTLKDKYKKKEVYAL